MRYSQITTSRLSKAASKLDADGNWHPFQSTPHSWYRVWKHRLVQRVHFEHDGDEQIFLPLLENLEPLKKLSGTTGFREVLDIQVRNDRFEMVAPLGYSNKASDELFRLLSKDLIVFKAENVVMCATPVTDITAESLHEAQTRLMEARLMFQETEGSTLRKLCDQ